MPVLKQNEVFAGRYILSQLIGEGGFSEVWKAKDQMADEAVVAIKIYAPDKGLDDYGVRQFRKEFSLTHHLSHPHLLKVYHFDISDGSPYLIMPYCAFGSLTKVLREEGVFSERQAALAMCQIGSALEELHRQDPPILHQDIKPDNILVLNAECYLLADFGISSQIRHTLRKATSNMQSLTVAYAPPERFDRHPTTDSASDIFSFGVTLYEMCTNIIPWDGSGGQCLLKGAWVPVLPETFSPELNALLESCMSLDRSKRPSALELHQRGKHFLETGHWRMPQKGKGANTAKKNLVRYMLAAAIALVILAGLWYTDLYPGSADFNKGVVASRVIEQGDKQKLEDKLKTMEAQLIEANQRIAQQDSMKKLLMQNKEGLPGIEQERLVSKGEEPNKSSAKRTGGKETLANSATPALEKKLNQLSDPAISKELRSGLRQEALSQFADASVWVLDESERDQNKYRAGVFLTILYSSPHQVVIKDVKRDQNNKIIELKLTKNAL